MGLLDEQHPHVVPKVGEEFSSPGYWLVRPNFANVSLALAQKNFVLNKET